MIGTDDIHCCDSMRCHALRTDSALVEFQCVFSVLMMRCCADTQPEALQSASADAKAAWAQSTMRCGGCAAKVGPQLLHRVLRSLRDTSDQAVQAGMPQKALSCSSKSVVSGQLDDAVVLPPPPEGCVSVQTVDFVNSFVDDPFVFGGIVALHAMSDCFAMGAEPSMALAMVQVRPHGMLKQGLMQNIPARIHCHFPFLFT